MRKAQDRVVRELGHIVGPAQVLHSPADLLVYEADALVHYTEKPRAVVLPGSTDEVVEVVRWCAAHDVPFVPRGAGTGLSGGALPCDAGIVLEMARMNRVLEVSRADRWAHVEVGLVNQELSQAVEETGLFYAPDPSSQSACTIGGNVAENSGGPHCMKYGMTTQHVLGLTVVLPDGTRIQLGGPLGAGPDLDLLGTFVGSEGTFGVATEAWVRLTRRPATVRLLFFAFSELESACHAVCEMIAEGVQAAALEMIDQRTIEVIEDSVYACGLPTDAAAVLLVELDGLTEQVDEETRQVERLSTRHGAFQSRRAESAEERMQMWTGRKVAFGALGRLKPNLYVQDTVVPRSMLASVLRRIIEIAEEHGVLLTNVFHAGDGNLHPNISYDGRDEHETAQVMKAGEAIIQTCLDAGGALSGEHGIGREKRDFMRRLFSGDDLALFSKLRECFNPRGLCNPDKVLPGTKVCAEFRERALTAEQSR